MSSHLIIAIIIIILVYRLIRNEEAFLFFFFVFFKTICYYFFAVCHQVSGLSVNFRNPRVFRRKFSPLPNSDIDRSNYAIRLQNILLSELSYVYFGQRMNVYIEILLSKDSFDKSLFFLPLKMLDFFIVSNFFFMQYTLNFIKFLFYINEHCYE